MVSVRLISFAALALLTGCGDDKPASGSPSLDAPSGSTTGNVDNRFPLPYPQAPVPEYALGQDVEITMTGQGWVPAKVQELAMVNGEQVVRTTWPGTTSGLPNLIMNKKNDIRPATGRLGQDLLIGRYTCYDGGTDRSDLNFRVAEYGKYTDPYGDKPGTFTTTGDRITFSGGVLDGQTAQQLQNNSEFYFTPQFKCRWHAEGL